VSAAVRSIFEQAMNTAAPRSPHDPSAPSNDNAPEHDVFDGVMSVEDAAALLHVGRNTIYGLVAQNKIPHRRLGKAIRFSRVALMAWLASWSVQGAKEGK
jgi:excisionase family DNA binding protein